MKCKLLVIFSFILMFSTIGTACSETGTTLTDAIKFYKAGNYSQCYGILEQVLKADPSNTLAYYYMGMTSTQLGRKEEAIANYEKVLLLETSNNNLKRYATKGKRCLETPEKCASSTYGSVDEEFILRKGVQFSEEVINEFDKLKMENLKREINQKDLIEPDRFKDFKDFSAVPTDEEIVAALRVLQRAGLDNMIGNNNWAMINGNSQNNSMLNMLGAGGMNQQLIQAFLTNNITQGF